MTQFVLLFRSDLKEMKSRSPEEMQKAFKKWMDWRDSLEKNGHCKNFGQRMEPSGKVVRGRAKAVTDGPFVEVKDSVQGYLLIEAKDMGQAVDLAKGCPILEWDGTVEVRAFMAA